MSVDWWLMSNQSLHVCTSDLDVSPHFCVLAPREPCVFDLIFTSEKQHQGILSLFFKRLAMRRRFINHAMHCFDAGCCLHYNAVSFSSITTTMLQCIANAVVPHLIGLRAYISHTLWESEAPKSIRRIITYWCCLIKLANIVGNVSVWRERSSLFFFLHLNHISSIAFQPFVCLAPQAPRINTSNSQSN